MADRTITSPERDLSDSGFAEEPPGWSESNEPAPSGEVAPNGRHLNLPEHGSREAHELYSLPTFGSVLFHADAQPPAEDELPDYTPPPPAEPAYDPLKVRPDINSWSLGHSLLRILLLVTVVCSLGLSIGAWKDSAYPVPAIFETRLGLVLGMAAFDAVISLLFSNPYPIRYAAYKRSWHVPARIGRLLLYDTILGLMAMAAAICVPPCWIPLDPALPIELPDGRMRPGFVALNSAQVCRMLDATRGLQAGAGVLHILLIIAVNLFVRKMRGVKHFGPGWS